MRRGAPPNPGVAAVLSFLFNGLGQIYNGQIVKGLVLMAVSTFLMIGMVVGAVFCGYYFLTGFRQGWALGWALWCLIPSVFGIALIGIYNIFDAYQTALRRREDEEESYGTSKSSQA